MNLILLNYFYIILFWLVEDSSEIKNVRLVVPPVTQAGDSATLSCYYNLEGATLYSVQWFHKVEEFYRYVPHEKPPTKKYRLLGLLVDEYRSDDHHVTLRNVPTHISGTYRCEITTNGPPFMTATVVNNFTVIDFKLDLIVPSTQVKFDAMITGSCTVSPYFSALKLIFVWNRVSVPEKFIKRKMETIYLDLNFTFARTQGARMYSSTTHRLNCTLLYGDEYYINSKYLSLELLPVNYKSNGSNLKFTLLWFIIIYLIIQNN